ncbi:unnamed protein product [Sphagnum jensenii]|uniref:Aminotransferase class V domain-containing protein n=1 Tax=Sphagnum jensenii TaxID=128206 RepID=A0ABP0VAC7_9BRYO
MSDRNKAKSCMASIGALVMAGTAKAKRYCRTVGSAFSAPSQRTAAGPGYRRGLKRNIRPDRRKRERSGHFYLLRRRRDQPGRSFNLFRCDGPHRQKPVHHIRYRRSSLHHGHWKVGTIELRGKMAPADKNGRITAGAIAEAMTPRTALVSIAWANGLTGVINPIEEIAAICKERGVHLHIDASHVLGKVFAEWEEVPAHFLTFNGDSIHAPSGTGALFIRGDVKCSPMILGGIEQGGYRAGPTVWPDLPL